MIYGMLYEAMLAWFRRRGIEDMYLRVYVTMTLTALAFINVLSLAALLAYLGIGTARVFFADLNWEMAVTLVAVLLVIHVMYVKARRHSQAEHGAGFRWIAPGYIFASIALACYMSTLVSAFRR